MGTKIINRAINISDISVHIHKYTPLTFFIAIYNKPQLDTKSHIMHAYGGNKLSAGMLSYDYLFHMLSLYVVGYSTESFIEWAS